MEDSKFFCELPDSEYGEGVMLDEYHEKWSLVAARKAKDGKVYMSWCFPQGIDRKPKEKGVPWKVNLGNQKQALKTLKHFIALLGRTPDSEEIPF